MASKSKVTLTFAGDSDQLEKSFKGVSSAAERMAADVKSSSAEMSTSAVDSFDRVGEGAGTLDTRAMGFRDTITGVQDTMAALNDDSLTTQERMLTLGAGVGDLASGFENLIIPMIKAGAQSVRTAATWVASHASMVASTVAAWVTTAASAVAGAATAAAAAVVSAATQVAAWIGLAAASLAGAASVALAWIISMGPIALVIAAVVGLVVIIVKNWDTIKSVIMTAVDAVKGAISTGMQFIKDKISAALGFIKNNWQTILAILTGPIGLAVLAITKNRDKIVTMFKALPGKIKSALSGLKNAFVAPFKAAFQGIKDLWNRTLGGKGINIPGFAGFGGISFTIPRLAKGGIVKASPGGSIVNVGEGGRDEAIVPLGRGGGLPGGGATVLELRSDGGAVAEMVLTVLREAVANQGGNVQLVLGN